MWKEIWRKCILLGLVLCLRGVPVWAEDAPLPEGLLTVAVHDHAGVSASTLAQAEQTASFIFKQAGLRMTLVNCGLPAEGVPADSSCRTTQFPNHLQLTIVLRSKNLKDSALGVSYLGEDGHGCYSDVFLGPAEELRGQLRIDLGTLLGHVIAHEIAHLLLGSNSHSASGIMRAHWDQRDLADAKRGALLFSPAQGKIMRDKVSAGSCRSDNASVALASGPRLVR